MINDGINCTDNEIISFLMIGQSNMAGRGELDEVEKIKNDMCYMLRMGRWQPMSEPVNVDRAITGIRYHSGVSLATSFADMTAKHTGNKIGLIPCADGGTRLDQWMPGGILFDHAVMMTKLALRTSRLGGIIWHQGESDKQNFDADTYRKNFIYMMNELRKAVGATELPLIVGELSENSVRYGEYASVFNELLHSMKNEIHLYDVASSKGLELKTDDLHFTSASCRELGKRYFEKYIQLADILSL